MISEAARNPRYAANGHRSRQEIRVMRSMVIEAGRNTRYAVNDQRSGEE
jgi:hypothetical protein